MRTDQLLTYLEQPASGLEWLQSLGFDNVDRAHANTVSIAKSGLTLDLAAVIFDQLAEHLPRISDADMALNNLDRFLAAARNPLALGSLMERDPTALPVLLQIFSTSQHLSDVLVTDPESYDLLRMTEGEPVSRQALVDEVAGEVEVLQADEAAVMAALRRYKRRETMRIAYGDIIRGQSVSVVAQQISYLADALIEGAVQFAHGKVSERRGTPRRPDGQPARFAVLALGKLGGVELNYSSDIDVIFLYDKDGTTDGARKIGNQEYFDRVGREVFRVLNDATDLGNVYRVDLRLRPEGSRGPMVVSLESALHYYDVLGRTWERQAFVKARAAAGDLELGQTLLNELEPWIYRRYLSRADITGIKALKRRIEQRTLREGGDRTDVKTGYGGIRDIEFIIQFLQLLNGGDLPNVRTGNTLKAIDALERAGCLTLQERSFLEENYAFLRKIEHRLQIMFDLQTHTMPQDDQERRKLAIRMGYEDTPERPALPAFNQDFKTKTEVNHKILKHLLHDVFGEQEDVKPEVDLVLDPDPSPDTIAQVLGPYHFRQIDHAYQNLMALSEERVRFLSTRRCRLFLASISPHLLKAIAATPDPDATLISLSKVSDSLGGKGVLWELFSFNQPTLDLYVRLCASSPYLAGILNSNPGMIDELMDSLLLDKLPTAESLQSLLHDLCRGAKDIDPILHSFKNSQHLNVGVRDILGKEDIRATHRTLSNIAEVCLTQVATREYERLVERYGQPTVGDGPRAGEKCEPIIVALGKVGGREPNYHSDLDIIFVYEAEGQTRHVRPNKRDGTTNQHFFSQWGQRIIKTMTHLGPYGRLFEIDPRLRPTGKSGTLALSLTEFARYHREGQAQLWERQTLCKARPVYGSIEIRERTIQVVRDAIMTPLWEPEYADEIRRMRMRMEESATKDNLKRGPGGTVDIEFLTQMLQLRHAMDNPSVLVPGTLAALEMLHETRHLSDEDFQFLSQSYRFLRSIEARLRLMNTTARHNLPKDPGELTKLAFLLDYPTGQMVHTRCRDYMAENRVVFNRIFDEAARETV